MNSEAPPFNNATDLHETIDATELGEVPWQAFSVSYAGELPSASPTPAWMTAKYEVWFRDPLQVCENQLSNPDFATEMDWAPKRVFKKGKREYCDFMSGNWSWEEAVCF